MKVTLEFKEEDSIEARQAFNGGNAHSALWDIMQLLRSKKKNSDTVDSDELFQEVNSIIMDYNINLNE